ncbi:hypothetical protein [Phenylobacterium sp.]|uniref:hypothetical protein n=1 Tax=Phenylobacterium sp. TaxID=1871053 RepID=UPI0025CE6C45|nr:hypothetical protein [Phenylobacterium sp.]MBX3485158.1 hypothetical protein [Phenylobacterium sp.]MCW5761305.1 hypothetical protein [Phenylobacterium sp.]
MPAPSETVSVRMYRGLLGDCFLLRHQIGDQRFHALIDCGVLQCIGAAGAKPQTGKGAARLKQAIASLQKDTRGADGRSRLDLVVATHEHYDHLSGFILGHDAFRDDFEFGDVWVAWTEDPDDDQAKDIRARGRKALSALKFIADRSTAFGVDGDAQARLSVIRDLLQFYDADIEAWAPEPDGLGAAAGTSKPKPAYDPARDRPRSCANAIDWLRHRATGKVSYLEPGDVVTFGLGERLTAKVMGPPRKAERLLQLDPSRDGGREVYLLRPGDAAPLESRLRLGLAKGDPGLAGPADLPFSPRFRRRESRTSKHLTERLYRAKESSRRRIDGEWLETAEHLAMKIDGDVNNTSLVLAIETRDRHVLLFPADAQVGNWLSWHDQRYPRTASAVGTESAADILGRVVLYKVGHHGSHNATARDQGLELMTSPHLAAMIPVVEDVAGEQKTRHNPTGWAMPFRPLAQRLEDLTAKRILKGDGKRADEEQAFANSLFGLTYAGAGADPLWVEVSLPVETPDPAHLTHL